MRSQGAPNTSRLRAAAGSILVALALLYAAAVTPAAGQEEPSRTSYITPFPEGDTYRLQTYAVAFAEGLLSGLIESFAGDARVQVATKHRAINGLARAEFTDDFKVEEGSRDAFHIGVIM